MTTDEPRSFRQTRFRRPPGACEIILVRHGESAPAVDGQPFPLVDGHSDPPLDPVGTRQAELVADRLLESGEQIAAIYVTPLQRTQQTAAPLAAKLGLEPRVEPDLREVYLGDWESSSVFRRHVAEGHPLVLRMYTEQRWDVVPGSEPAADFAMRVRRGLTTLAQAHPDQTIVVVVHGGVIGQVLADATGSRALAFAGADNGSISHVVVAGDLWMVRRFNDTSHLGPAFTLAPEPLT